MQRMAENINVPTPSPSFFWFIALHDSGRSCKRTIKEQGMALAKILAIVSALLSVSGYFYHS